MSCQAEPGKEISEKGGSAAILSSCLKGTMRIYTIGHSNRSIDDFLALLERFGIQTLVDVRSRPGSRSFPHFNRENLAQSLLDNGITYLWMEELGGLRRRVKGFDSPNMGLTTPGFRAYADYMGSQAFQNAVTRLQSAASESTAAIMCAEALYWRCHRRLLSDYLLANGIEVLHILGDRRPTPHSLTPEARIAPGGVLFYPGPAE